MEILNDFNVSVQKALEEIDPNYLEYPGLVVCGTHSPHDVEEMITKITKARLNGIPFLGICFGHQLAAIEWARANGTPDATSEEFGEGTYVVKKLPNLVVGLKDGESYWHNYEVDIDWQPTESQFTCQFHPEYQSSKDKPHPLLLEFLTYAKEKQYERNYDLAMQNSTVIR